MRNGSAPASYNLAVYVQILQNTVLRYLQKYLSELYGRDNISDGT